MHKLYRHLKLKTRRRRLPGWSLTKCESRDYSGLGRGGSRAAPTARDGAPLQNPYRGITVIGEINPIL